MRRGDGIRKVTVGKLDNKTSYGRSKVEEVFENEDGVRPLMKNMVDSTFR